MWHKNIIYEGSLQGLPFVTLEEVSHTLNLSRTNAKAILDSVNLPQSSRLSERLLIVICNLRK